MGNINDKYYKIIDEYNNNLITDTNRQDKINELMSIRNKMIKLVDNARYTYERRSKNLSDINSSICLIQGHIFDEDNICKICGINKEKTKKLTK